MCDAPMVVLMERATGTLGPALASRPPMTGRPSVGGGAVPVARPAETSPRGSRGRASPAPTSAQDDGPTSIPAPLTGPGLTGPGSPSSRDRHPHPTLDQPQQVPHRHASHLLRPWQPGPRGGPPPDLRILSPRPPPDRPEVTKRPTRRSTKPSGSPTCTAVTPDWPRHPVTRCGYRHRTSANPSGSPSLGHHLTGPGSPSSRDSAPPGAGPTQAGPHGSPDHPRQPPCTGHSTNPRGPHPHTNHP